MKGPGFDPPHLHTHFHIAAFILKTLQYTDILKACLYADDSVAPCIGKVFILHVKGPGFDPPHLHTYFHIAAFILKAL